MTRGRRHAARERALSSDLRKDHRRRLSAKSDPAIREWKFCTTRNDSSNETLLMKHETFALCNRLYVTARLIVAFLFPQCRR